MSTNDEWPDEVVGARALPPYSTVSFLHAVGKSTIQQGMTVPVIAQIGWLAGIQKGQAVPVTIRFGSDQSVPATLRRINNARGHLQFRYESKKQAALQEYFTAVFGNQPDPANGLVRVSELEPRVFLFEPVCAGPDTIAALSIWNPYFHNCNPVEVQERLEYKELQRCFATIPYDEDHNQSHYNREIASTLSGMGWRREARILDQIGLRCDYEKNGVWVEVEFGNARVYYQDYVKFLLALRHRATKLGILLCPTNAFAQLLCDLGQRRALVRRRGNATHRPIYSGMMSYEKAMRELPFLEFMLTGGIVIAGIEIQRGSL
jgi:hypothetical protein